MYSSSLGMFLFRKRPMAEPITKFRQSVLRYVNGFTGPQDFRSMPKASNRRKPLGAATQHGAGRVRIRDGPPAATSSPPAAAHMTHGAAWRE
ncbi:hypothetical protein [Burkholderia latens]|uniref:hypothetical protein n=1 Tax=Burkholderia latens TaxID=488446 RepID=UPI0039A407DF